MFDTVTVASSSLPEAEPAAPRSAVVAPPRDLEMLGPVAILQEIHEGRVAPDEIPLDLRQRIVAHLVTQGYRNDEIALFLRVSERTVRRDRAAVRELEAMRPTLTLGDELLGEFESFTLGSVARLTRLACDPSAAPYARLWAEDAASRIYDRFLRAARDLDYLQDGKSRLEHLRQTDAAWSRTVRQTKAAMLRNVTTPLE